MFPTVAFFGPPIIYLILSLQQHPQQFCPPEVSVENTTCTVHLPLPGKQYASEATELINRIENLNSHERKIIQRLIFTYPHPATTQRCTFPCRPHIEGAFYRALPRLLSNCKIRVTQVGIHTFDENNNLFLSSVLKKLLQTNPKLTIIFDVNENIDSIKLKPCMYRLLSNCMAHSHTTIVIHNDWNNSYLCELSSLLDDLIDSYERKSNILLDLQQQNICLEYDDSGKKRSIRFFNIHNIKNRIELDIAQLLDSAERYDTCTPCIQYISQIHTAITEHCSGMTLIFSGSIDNSTYTLVMQLLATLSQPKQGAKLYTTCSLADDVADEDVEKIATLFSTLGFKQLGLSEPQLITHQEK